MSQARERVKVGDIVFIGELLRRIRVTKVISNRVCEGVNDTARRGKPFTFKSRLIRGMSPMSPLEPTVIPRAVVIGIHVGCGGKVWYSATRKFGSRYCGKCRVDGRYGRPVPLLEGETDVY
jgi:hypothetical protein